MPLLGTWNEMGFTRDRLMMLADVLIVSEHWISRTKIKTYVSGNHGYNIMIDHLADAGLLEFKTRENPSPNEKGVYKRTEEGRKFLKEIDRIYKVIGVIKDEPRDPYRKLRG